MTRMTWPGQDLGPRKSKCPNVETSLAFLGNGKAASGLAMASNVVTEDWVRQTVGASGHGETCSSIPSH